MYMRFTKGFTLIELMVTVAVVAILATIAFPSFQSTIRSNRVAAANNEIVGMVNLARSEAIRSGQGAVVCGSSTGASCDGSWALGVAAVSDPDGNGDATDGTVLRFTDFKNSMTVTGPAEVIAFDGRGRRRHSTDQSLTIRPVTCTANVKQKRSMVVNASGQLRSTKETCS
jgi:type IV fimbrial biogenesis protein FimT